MAFMAAFWSFLGLYLD